VPPVNQVTVIPASGRSALAWTGDGPVTGWFTFYLSLLVWVSRRLHQVAP
jgi:hypothetical protein